MDSKWRSKEIADAFKSARDAAIVAKSAAEAECLPQKDVDSAQAVAIGTVAANLEIKNFVK